MVQSPSWEANRFAASQEIPRISRNPKVHYRTDKPVAVAQYTFTHKQYTEHSRHKYRVIQKDGLNWTVNGASTHARQLVAVFQVLCSLYAQNSLEFVPRPPLIHVFGRSFCLYTDSLFAQIVDSNDRCSSSLDAQCWNEDETQAAQQSPAQF